MDLHPIEAAWRRFLNSAQSELLRKSLAARSSYLRFIKLDWLPNEVVLPGAVTWAGAGRERPGETTVRDWS